MARGPRGAGSLAFNPQTTATPARAAPVPKIPRIPANLNNGGSVASSSNLTNWSHEANSDSTADRQHCQSLQQAAVKCCMDPSQCGGPLPVQVEKVSSSSDLSFPDLCNKMNSAGTAEANNGLNAGNMCVQKYSTCQEECNSLANSYSGSVADGFRSVAQACTALSSRATALQQAAKASNTAANSGQNCDGLTQAMAQGLNAFGGAGRDTKSAALNRPGADAPQLVIKEQICCHLWPSEGISKS